MKIIKQEIQFEESLKQRLEFICEFSKYILEEGENKIIATCGLQIIDYLPQCNDNGKQGYLCNVYTDKNYRNK